MVYEYEYAGQRHHVQVEAAGDSFVVTVDGRAYQVKANRAGAGEWVLELDGLRRCLAYLAAEGANRWVALSGNVGAASGQTYLLTVPDARRGSRHRPAAGPAPLKAQMPGTVRQVLVAEGQNVVRGQTLALLEAMKMEIRITAPEAGVVMRVTITAGQTVERGQALFALAPVSD